MKIKTYNPFKTSLLTAAIISSFSVSVTAQEQKSANSTNNIEMIVVEGQATSGLDRLIDQQQLEKLQANDLEDIFRLDTSINVGGAVGSSQKIYLRNVGEDMLHISIDGAEIAEAVFHHSGRITVEPEILKQVEVEAGTGSAAVGPGALGGAVRLTTKDPLDMLKDDALFGGLLKVSHFDNGSGMKYSATAYGADENRQFSGMVNLVTSDFDNLEDGNGDEIVGSGAKKNLGYVKGVAHISDSQYLSVSYETLEEKGDVLYKPELIPSRKNWISPTEGTRESAILNYGYDQIDNDLINVKVTAYQSTQEQKRFYPDTLEDGTAINYLVDGRVESVGLNIQNTSETADLYIVYGLNYRSDESTLIETSQTNKEDGKVLGVFAQGIFDVSKSLTVSTGIRFDDYALTDWQGQKITDSGFSPNLSANFKLTDSLGLSAGYASAMRGPKVKDSYKIGYYSNDPAVKAETATNLELGLDYQGENFEVGIGRYASTIKDPIGNMAPWGKVAANLEHDLETEGYYLQFDLNVGNFHLHTDLNHATTEFNGDKATRYFHSSTATSMGDNYIFDLSYVLSDALTLGWVTQYVEKINTFDVLVDQGGPYEEIITASKPGYTLHDLYAAWSPLDNVKVNLAVKNITDKAYLSQGSVEDLRHNAGYGIISGQNSAGRDIRLTVSYSF